MMSIAPENVFQIMSLFLWLISEIKNKNMFTLSTSDLGNRQ